MGLDMNVFVTDGEVLTEDNFQDLCLNQMNKFYWRKANQIHKFFVDEVQGGKDECQISEIHWSDIQNLKKKVRAVLKDPAIAPDILPTKSGFFFGLIEYDEYYFENLEITDKYIQKMEVIKAQNPDTKFFYWSSW